MPGMQPANWWAGSKSAALASVSSAPSASSRSGSPVLDRPRREAWQRPSISTARFVQTAHWPSRPPDKWTAASVSPRRERRQQVGHDLVVVAGVERDVVAAALGQRRVTSSV